MRSTLQLLIVLAALLLGPAAMAVETNPLELKAFSVTTNAEGEQEYSVTIQILMIMTALGFIPAIVMLMTSFTRIIIVFSILRQALGLQQAPSNQVLLGLA